MEINSENLCVLLLARHIVDKFSSDLQWHFTLHFTFYFLENLNEISKKSKAKENVVIHAGG